MVIYSSCSVAVGLRRMVQANAFCDVVFMDWMGMWDLDWRVY